MTSLENLFRVLIIVLFIISKNKVKCEKDIIQSNIEYPKIDKLDTNKYKINLILDFGEYENKNKYNNFNDITISQDGQRFNCFIPPIQEDYLFYNEENKQYSNKELSKMDHINQLENLLRPLYKQCIWQELNTGGITYLYEFCYKKYLRRSVVDNVKFQTFMAVTDLEELMQKGLNEYIGVYPLYDSFGSGNDIIDTTKISLNERFSESIKWNYVQNDKLNLLESRTTDYFYQDYNNVTIQFHCYDSNKFLSIREVNTGSFIAILGSPHICKHDLIENKNKPISIDCHIDDQDFDNNELQLYDSDDKYNLEGRWKIFKGGGSTPNTFLPQYNGIVHFTNVSSIREEAQRYLVQDYPSFFQVDWLLQEDNSYSGYGLYFEDDSDSMCVVWSTSKTISAGMSFYKFNDDFTEARGYWYFDEYTGIELVTANGKNMFDIDQYFEENKMCKNDLYDKKYLYSLTFPENIKLYYRYFNQYTCPLNRMAGKYTLNGMQIFSQNSYNYDLNISYNRMNKIYRLTYNINEYPKRKEHTIYGIGIETSRGNNLCVIWSDYVSSQDGIVLYEFYRNKVKGTWTLSQSNVLQREDLVRSIQY
eukprot:TRINITY_DN12553_c0_g1_i1.p1 TRINITY_DN12553_c0_g1~~TRINITY_DN12553_c0_g1_i1.p1  ORF type:complete len:591 (+),score=105.17 TRINITY_DN12553_c0_g1_i1:54-1826(+)